MFKKTQGASKNSIITCPDCMHHAIEAMPQDACIYLYECRNCQKLITPQQGDCCVFCSHGSQPCPTSQRDKKAYAQMPSITAKTATANL